LADAPPASIGKEIGATALEPAALTQALAEIIERLEEARSNALVIRDADDFYHEDLDLDSPVVDNVEGLEAAILDFESRMQELTQVLGEELDSLRGILEVLEEDQ
jgi:hypothetical protein